jgi:hypothetical protein
MTATTHQRRSLAEMSEKELVAIRMVINRLSKIEYWIRQNTRKLRGDAPGSENGSTNTANIRIDVFCILRESDPAFDPNGENFVAKLDGRAVLTLDTRTRSDGKTDTREADFRALSDMHICGLFHDLYEFGIARNWDALIQIGEISVEMYLDHAPKACDGGQFRYAPEIRGLPASITVDNRREFARKVLDA